jgi:hypothetical protein
MDKLGFHTIISKYLKPHLNRELKRLYAVSILLTAYKQRSQGHQAETLDIRRPKNNDRHRQYLQQKKITMDIEHH